MDDNTSLKLLHVVDSIDPRLGGVAESIVRRGEFLLSIGHSVEVVSLDLPTETFVKSYPLVIHALGKGLSAWSYSGKLRRWLGQNISRFDAVIVEGLWKYQSFVVRSIALERKVPYFVFPHGMLDPWFKTTYPVKHLKKRMFWSWCEGPLLEQAAAVLFTTREESILARRSFPSIAMNARVVPFGTGRRPEFEYSDRDDSDSFGDYLLFMGRIHPKKGCDLVLKALARTRSQHNLVLVMAGPGNAEYVSLLKHMATTLDVSDRVQWPGMITGVRKWQLLAGAKAFILPSHQENFGIAVAEALSCGTPVIVSNKVNIWEDIKSYDAGIVCEDDETSVAMAVSRIAAWSVTDHENVSIAARKLYEERYTVEAMGYGLVEAVRSHLRN